ncbi:unnamed protein product [Amoebophrya sp. A25]|nr:unnamed protein product [Amoebophrya sp. A25]|eukprot:GSA25T00009124001.1
MKSATSSTSAKVVRKTTDKATSRKSCVQSTNKSIEPGQITVLDDHGSSVLYLPKALWTTSSSSSYSSYSSSSSLSGFSAIQNSSTSKWPDQCFQRLLSECPWAQGAIKIFGKEIPEPRLTCYFGEHSYKYSGRLLQRAPFDGATCPKVVAEVKREVERILSVFFSSDNLSKRTLSSKVQHIEDASRPIEFNSVLLNRYRTLTDSQGWHSDDEAVYGKDPAIASVSLGCERDFVFRRKISEKEKWTLKLEHGSLLFMFGPIQHHWQHSLPKRTGKASSMQEQQERINLTFRKIVNPMKV